MDFFYDSQRNLLIYPSQNPFLLQHLPDARTINGGYMAVPFTLPNAQVLRYYNHPVPAVITNETYDFPIEAGRTPGAHQVAMANFDALHRKAFNLSSPGTQKTLAKIWMADWLMRQYPPGECRVLIVAPLTILETVWAETIFKNLLSRRSIEVIYGDAGKRSKILAKKPDFGIINFDGVGVGARTRKGLELAGFSAELANDNAIRIVIIDEADAYCDSTTKRHRIARLIFGKRPYLLLQTGTPTGNAPVNAYGMAKLVNNAFGKSFTTFRNETMYQPFPNSFKWLPRQDGYDKARALLTPAIRFSLDEVWKDQPGFPPAETRKVALTAEQEKEMASLKRDLQVMMASGKLINATNEASARQKYLQIAMGAVYDGEHIAHLTDAAPRYSEIEYLVERAEHKVLVFAGLTSVVHLLYKLLSKRWKCGIINGEVGQKERVRLIHAFETDPDFKCMIMDPQPTAHGINEFVVADTVIWFGPTEKTRLYIQGNARAMRPGQKNTVFRYHIVATKLEQEIFTRLETNTTLQGALLAAIQKGEL